MSTRALQILFLMLQTLYVVHGCPRTGPPPGARPSGPRVSTYATSTSELQPLVSSTFPGGLNISITPADETKIIEGDTILLQANFTPSIPGEFHLDVWVSDHDVARVVNISWILEDGGSCEEHIKCQGAGIAGARIEVKGKRLGRSQIQLEVSQNDTSVSLLDYEVIVLRERVAIVGIFTHVVTALMVLINFGFGCELDPKVIWSFVKKPIPPAIGFFCQFLAMPLIGLAVTQILQMDKIFGFGLIALACSPGGGASNSWTILLGGDVNLSLTMTFLSITLAMGMMPLWLFIVSHIYLNPEDVQVPYLIIIQTLAIFVIPCILGVSFHKLKPKWGKKIAKLLKPFALIFLLWIFTVGIYVNLYMYKLMGSIPTIIPAAILLPWVGFLLGFCIATACRQPRRRAITIAIETGIQNIGIPIVMLQGNFPQPEGDLAATMASAVGAFTPIPLYIALIVVLVRRKFFKDPEQEKIAADEEDNWDVVDPDDMGKDPEGYRQNQPVDQDIEVVNSTTNAVI